MHSGLDHRAAYTLMSAFRRVRGLLVRPFLLRVFVVVNLPCRQPRDVFKGDAWIVSLTRVVSGPYSWDAHLLDLSEPQAGN